MRFLLPLFFALSVLGQPNPPTDTNAQPDATCIAFIDNPVYCRMEYGRWYLTNWNKASDLYLNGVFQSGQTEAAGTASIDFLAWPSKRSVKVGIVNTDHGIALDNLITNVCPSAVLFHSTQDAAGVLDCVSNGCQVILHCTPTSMEGGSTTELSNGCWMASRSNVVLVCSVQNSTINIDNPITPGFPASWNLPLSIPVCSSTRQDQLYSPTATGSNVIAAPGRVIVTQAPDGSPAYGTGASYAAPIVAGVVAWMLGQFTNQTPQVIVSAIYKGLVKIDTNVSGRISMLGAVNALRPAVKLSVLGIDGAMYAVERSENLQSWTAFATLLANGSTNAMPGFYRARIL